MTEKSLESLIDKALDKIENAELSAEEFCQQLLEDHPVLFDYLFSRDYDVLNSEEADYTLFLSSVLLETIRMWKGISAGVEVEQLEDQEESYWEQLDQERSRKTRDPYDAALPQTMEDALAGFILDALDEKEIEFLTPPGKALIFVKLATLTSVLT